MENTRGPCLDRWYAARVQEDQSKEPTTMDNAFIDENAVALQRLQHLVESLTDDDLLRPAGDGWTVAALLAHLAFWDYRALDLLRRWQSGDINPSPVDIDVLNDTLQRFFLEIPPRTAARMVLEAAWAVDSELERLPLDWLARVADQGRLRRRRCEHREEHIEQI